MTNSNPSTPDPQDAEPRRSSDPLEEMGGSGNESDHDSGTSDIVASGANAGLEEIENILPTSEPPQASEDRSRDILAELETLFPPDETEPDAELSEALSAFGFDDLNLDTIPVQDVTSFQDATLAPDETVEVAVPVEPILAEPAFSAEIPEAPEPEPEVFEAAIPVEPILAAPDFSTDSPEPPEPEVFEAAVPIEPISTEPLVSTDFLGAPEPEPEAFEAAVPVEPILVEPDFSADIPEAPEPEPEALEAAAPVELISTGPVLSADIPETPEPEPEPEPEAFELPVPVEPISTEPVLSADISETPEPEPGAFETAVPIEPISAAPPAPEPSRIPVSSTSGVPAYREILNSREKVFGFLFILVSIGGILSWGWSQGMLNNVIKPSADKPQSSLDQGDGDLGDGDIRNGDIDGASNSPENSIQATGLKGSPSTNSSSSTSNVDGNAGSNANSNVNRDKPLLKPSAPSTPSKLDVSDVPPDHWGYNYVVAMDKAGILPAFPDGRFQPDKFVTRAELAASLQQAFAIPSQGNPTTFNDVPSAFWAQNAIANAVDTGFMSGYSKDSFRPDENIPRYQVLVSLVSGLGLDKVSDADQVLEIYPDANELPAWSKGQLAAAEKAKLIASPPQDDNRLNPNRPATRAEANAMIYKALVKYGKIKDAVPATP